MDLKGTETAKQVEGTKYSQLLVVIDLKLLLAPGGRVGNVELQPQKASKSDTRQPHTPSKNTQSCASARERRNGEEQRTFMAATHRELAGGEELER
jgi:hypothetical protein